MSVCTPKSFDLTGKVALITGASYGIGFAIATAMANCGATIVFNDIKQELVDKGLAAYKEAGITAHGYVCDVTNEDAVNAMVKQITEEVGHINILVNNAGITKDGLMARMSEEQYDAVIAVNQKSVFNMMKLVGTVMMRQRHGRIVSLASVAGLYGNPGQINYSASKAAIIGMTKTVAKELGARNVTVNAVAPGFIKTPMTDALTEEQRNKMLELVAMKRYGEPEEVANVISFLCSDDASYVTGQTIEISGGLMM